MQSCLENYKSGHSTTVNSLQDDQTPPTRKLALENRPQRPKIALELADCEEDLLQTTQDPEIAEEARATALDTDLQLSKTKWSKEAAENAEKLRPRPIPAGKINFLPSLFQLLYPRSNREHVH